MHRMRTTSGLGSPRFFAFTAFIGLILAALPGAVGANGDALVRDAGIESMVWLDANEDGMQDKSEVGVPDVNVSLLSCEGQFLAATRTDARGRYRFDVAQGCYRLRFAAQADLRFCPAGLGGDAKRDSDADPATGLTSTVNVTAGVTVRDVNAGVVLVKGAQLGDRVWEDTNANGVQDVGEKGLGNVSVQLLDAPAIKWPMPQALRASRVVMPTVTLSSTSCVRVVIDCRFKPTTRGSSVPATLRSIRWTVILILPVA